MSDVSANHLATHFATHRVSACQFSAYPNEFFSEIAPFNLACCARLIYWIYFRPSLLKHYIYQLDPNLFTESPGLQIFKTFHRPEYRNIYLAVMNASALVSSGLSLAGCLVLFLLGQWQSPALYDIPAGIAGIITGVALGCIFFMLFLTLFGVGISIARGILSSLVIGLSVSVSTGTLMSIGFVQVNQLRLDVPVLFLSGTLLFTLIVFLNVLTQRVSYRSLSNGLLVSVSLGIAIGFASNLIKAFLSTPQSYLTISIILPLGLVIGVMVGMTVGGAIGLAVGTIISAACSIIIVILFGILTEVMTGTVAHISWVESWTVGIMFGLLEGIAAIGISGAALSLVQGVFNGAFIGVALGTAVGWRFSSWPIGLIAVTLSSALAFRLPFHWVEWAGAVYSNLSGKRHPCEWDEVLTFPLPGSQKRLVQYLQKDPQKGLDLLVLLACNPFQRWVAQKGFKAFLTQQESPIHSLYALLESPVGNSYVSPPLTTQGWKALPTVNTVLLGELSSQWVDCSTDPTSRVFERVVYAATVRSRDARPTPMTELAKLLFQLVDAEGTGQGAIAILFNAHALYPRLLDYPGGLEIKQSFELMEQLLTCRKLSDIAEVVDIDNELLPAEQAIRPTVIHPLHVLQSIGLDIATYQASVSRVGKQNALLRSNDALDGLEGKISSGILLPEHHILRQIIAQWRHLVTEEGGKLGRATVLKPILNPYIAGNPVEKEHFVGREDIMRRLEELCSTTGQAPSIVLYGHRRMGKTSILHNLQAHLGSHTTIINFNLQLVGNVRHTGDLLYALAIELYDSLPLESQQQLTEPDLGAFVQHNPYQLLLRFLRRLNQVREEQRFVIAIDEFELLEDLINRGILERALTQFWRGLIQSHSWLVMIFAGLHTLSEMQQDYWSPFFSSVTSVPVSFLSPQSAYQLITQPSSDFDLEFEPQAVETIIKLTNGQPYLMQLMGRALVSWYNQQIFEASSAQAQPFTVKDVERIMDSPDFYLEGDAYFAGVWRQAATSFPEGQLDILRALSTAPLSEEALLTRLGDQVSAQAALETLVKHDVIHRRDRHFTYTVELMRRWVERTKLSIAPSPQLKAQPSTVDR